MCQVACWEWCECRPPLCGGSLCWDCTRWPDVSLLCGRPWPPLAPSLLCPPCLPPRPWTSWSLPFFTLPLLPLLSPFWIFFLSLSVLLSSFPCFPAAALVPCSFSVACLVLAHGCSAWVFFFLAVAACPGFAPFCLASASTWWSPSALSPSLVLPCFSWSLSAPPPASCRQCWRPPSRSQSSCGWSSCWPCLRYWCFMFKHSILDYSLLIDLFLDDSLLGGSVLYGPGVLLVLLSLWISCLSFSLRALS